MPCSWTLLCFPTAQGEYGEKAAANIMRVALQVVHHCHTNGIIHRDLKLANFLLSDPSDAAILKAIDFGASCFIQPGASGPRGSWAS